MVSETGKVYGIDVDGVLYGSVYFSKTGEMRPLGPTHQNENSAADAASSSF